MISDLMSVINSGARSNKYRVYVPMFDSLGDELDILVQTASLPGKSLTPTEVVVKGRKCYLRGEMSFDGTWEMSFLNTEDMKERNYFLSWIDEIANTNMNSQGLLGGLSIGGITVNGVINTINSVVDIANQLQNNPLGIFLGGGLQPSYQRDLKIEQLNSDGGAEMEMRLIGAFPITVSAVEYTDQNGEVSITTITFAYTDVEVVNDTKSIVSAVAGDGLASLFNP